ncbi:tail fiber protein [Bacteroides sp.]|uniref:tail fiber protein n=1 Tax=Bacteroides sp. TaxID=29523 RepID=UPI00345D6D8E
MLRNKNDYLTLFSLIGTTYGGNGATTLMLFNLNGAVPFHGMRYCIVTNGIYPTRQ